MNWIIVMTNKDKKIAIFFDSDNLSASYIELIYKKLELYGKIYISKSYIDWTSGVAKEWKNEIQKFGIEPIQVFPNTKQKSKGQKSEKLKNASDIKITIDVCNLINTSEIDLIVLVSSDSDFTSLAMNIKSKLIDCIIFGEHKAPLALQNACTEFIKLPIKKNKKNPNSKEVDLLKNIINNIKDTSEYILFAKIGKILKEEHLDNYTKYFDEKRWIEILKINSRIFDIKNENSTSKVKLK
ncbi:MAG TPA: NYN domain-containing protein [Arcobacter sp.]|nr:NYN domain-containing protein [Arcobacter sp.]